jgi:hypothetical protein
MVQGENMKKYDVVMVNTKLITVEACSAYEARIKAEKRENELTNTTAMKQWFATSVYVALDKAQS